MVNYDFVKGYKMVERICWGCGVKFKVNTGVESYFTQFYCTGKCKGRQKNLRSNRIRRNDKP